MGNKRCSVCGGIVWGFPEWTGDFYCRGHATASDSTDMVLSPEQQEIIELKKEIERLKNGFDKARKVLECIPIGEPFNNKYFYGFEKAVKDWQQFCKENNLNP